MTFCIITHVIHLQSEGKYLGYAPYVNEMNIWLKHVDKVIVVAPLKGIDKTAIHQAYRHDNIEFIEVPSFSLISFKEIIKSIFSLPILFFKIFDGIKRSNHIHLRCPGNMGLLGALVQILFPKKIKTAKYAGNWDSNSKQPLSYKIQKSILNNTFLTKNMQVLVYGDWKNQTKNIKSFFTATYREDEKIAVTSRNLNTKLQFLFVGTLSNGKQPIYAVKLVESLKNKGINVQLSIYGEGQEKEILENYIQVNNLNDVVFLKGNVNRDAMKLIYQQSHFLILPSKSEGWPKVVAEAMFWGCLPIASKVSCVPNMLGNGERGILLSEELEKDSLTVVNCIQNQELYDAKINAAISWSRNFTIDKFESEIEKLLKA
jgi:glycosyltransferase involved in cell wall biosynthesis